MLKLWNMTLRRVVSNLVGAKTRARYIDLEYKAQALAKKLNVGWLLRPLFLKELHRRPEQIDIEVTSACDADCIMCPRKKMSRDSGAMKFELFQKIVDQAVELGVPKLTLNGYGEISILKEYEKYLGYIREKSRAIKIAINSNGMRMNEKMIDSYLRHEVDVVNVTIDGATAETFEAIRKQLSLEQVEGNVRKLIEERNRRKMKKPLVSIFMIVMPQNEHEVDAFLKKWTGVADQVGLYGVNPRAGGIDIKAQEYDNWQTTPCYLLWSQMPILSDGSQGMCCDDWNAEVGMGNANDTSIQELWQTQARTRFQRIHLGGGNASMPLCAACKQPRKGPWWFSKTG